MARMQRRGGGFTATRAGRLGACWALLTALLIVIGLAAPGPTGGRPAAEYSAPARAAAEAFPLRSPEVARPRAVCALATLLADGYGLALADDGPVRDLSASRDPPTAPLRAYQATGPPPAGFSQPA